MKNLKTIIKSETFTKVMLGITIIVFCTICYIVGAKLGERLNEMASVEKTISYTDSKILDI